MILRRFPALGWLARVCALQVIAIAAVSSAVHSACAFLLPMTSEQFKKDCAARFSVTAAILITVSSDCDPRVLASIAVPT